MLRLKERQGLTKAGRHNSNGQFFCLSAECFRVFFRHSPLNQIPGMHCSSLIE